MASAHVCNDDTNKGAQLSVQSSSVLSVDPFNKHLHMTNKLQSLFILCPAHFPRKNAFTLCQYLHLYHWKFIINYSEYRMFS